MLSIVSPMFSEASDKTFHFAESGMKNIKILPVQRYGLENMFNWILLKKPQIKNPSFEINESYDWLEKYFKSYLSKKLISDTIIAVGSNS